MHVKTGPLLLISLSLGLQLASTPAVSAAESAAEGLLIEGSSTVYPLTREAVSRFQRSLGIRSRWRFPGPALVFAASVRGRRTSTTPRAG
ncbi:hypothetical protein N7335_14355 [Stutzerimonas stutzeri]|uniref:Peptidoglycan binding-like domain-containing protein n=1 Tax=Stutzerimonas stutzeri TaxID=316 RepID=A0AA42HDC9_STUST|nr:hypothetical protein [Stutzerimonas stutzeri]MDH0147571.1 hypothetical protein [Stutzerimonas stutzeri]MDH0151801.1 hypothetical protein [Stutzerimonas stutzeri]MDH0609940.1 hypothetical protein [Stutzerimonas stutzeri]